MPLLVSFYRPSISGDGQVRQVEAYQSIALNATTTARPAGERGMLARCFNSETSPIRIAWGTTPDAAASAATAATTAGIVVGAGQALDIALDGAESISAKAV